ncbi:MAG: hypothetical protein MKZ89_08240 [Nisaea sp.]|jgi:hypothetical protein|nr:hypothetical protein [Nisaea sp.]MEC7973135.1 hypothetical protein [Pseudomonadota bacterium]
MSEDWLYQIRIRVNDEMSSNLRKNKPSGLARQIKSLARKHGTTLVCTYDAFVDYCREAESNSVEDYPLYAWTKQTIENPEKKQKHLKSFAFYRNNDQVYERALAETIYSELLPLADNGTIDEVKLIDSNPANNPQPPKS